MVIFVLRPNCTMKKLILPLFLFQFLCFETISQCLTDFQKIVPDLVNYRDNSFGSAVAIYGDYMVVGAVEDDSLGSGTGIAYVYYYQKPSWQKVAILNLL